MANNHWLTRRERMTGPYRLENWVERWQRLTGNVPDVEKVKQRSAQMYSHTYKFRGAA